MLARVALAGGLLAAAAPCAGAADCRDEAAQLADEIVHLHPRGHEIAGTPEFVAARGALLAMAGDTDLPHYAMALGRLFHAADDGHTAVIPAYSEAPEFTAQYPLRLRRFEDGLYVVAAKEDATALLGARLTAVGGEPVERILRGFAAAQAAGNRAWPANWTALGLTRPGWLIGLDVIPADVSARVRFEGVDGSGRRAVALLAASKDGQQGLTSVGREQSLLESLSDGAANFVAEVDEGRALALVVGAMEDSDVESFEAFTAEAAAAVNSTTAARVVVDLRDNGGGNNMLAEPLRRTLVKSRFNRPGGLYVLTSPQTFSAAMNFATRLERETDALFVGEPTGGAPNHYGDAKFARAPVSKLPYLISTLRWQDSTPFDARPWILPDLPAPPRYADYRAGRDAALEAALAHDVGPPEDGDWRLRVVKPWERPSQRAGWRFFYEEEGAAGAAAP